MQLAAEAHETTDTAAQPLRKGSRFHMSPFQRKIKMAPQSPPVESPPVAMQAKGDQHDTPTRTAVGGKPGGPFTFEYRVCWIDHFLPFQCITRAPVLSPPTAVHDVWDEHDTARTLPPGSKGVS
jgi:hypothetical protein